LPEGLKENDKLPAPIITPATKAVSGHDEDISYSEIISQNILSKSRLDELCDNALALFDLGTNFAASKNLILVDTKYEFGLFNNEATLIDEIHTPDSSRFFYGDTYEKLQNEGKQQRQLSKEFVREWLMENGFQGLEGQLVPDMPDDFVMSISDRYQELFNAMTGNSLVRREYDNILDTIETNVNNALNII
jgi:phosphoribosylaminoimidazole-succinocarboxamide synthase